MTSTTSTSEPTHELFFPLPGTYAFAELDIDNTLRGLDDPVATAEGARVKPAKCIVYLSTVLRLPFPSSETFKYATYLIGPGLRPPIPERLYNSEMCMPIYPATYHPQSDVLPLRSEPPFPFSNCYHWFGSDMEPDLRIINDGRNYRDPARIVLPAGEHVRMEGARSNDIIRILTARRAKAQESREGDPSATPCQRVSPPAPTPEMHDRCDEAKEGDSLYSCDDDASRSSRSSVSIPDEANDSVEALNRMDIFGFLGRDDLIPIVKIWLDIGSQLKEEDVPNPMEFVEQYNELVRIVQESKTRAAKRRASALEQQRSLRESGRAAASEDEDGSEVRPAGAGKDGGHQQGKADAGIIDRYMRNLSTDSRLHKLSPSQRAYGNSALRSDGMRYQLSKL
ncbi:hypothetical protein PYCCODRAFT_1461866 [Trametes coccinea BRFM310]|uniref:Uncharacterized protein n=1 Tax=Trametes coccinea (strain BRFM310) TaxID=1353009 RepID=A0A1Y2I8Z1_TRAC3|nr:hypothetical protein PYCCODRAFT_1461866 [Trametes coccinea BRFM310]